MSRKKSIDILLKTRSWPKNWPWYKRTTAGLQQFRRKLNKESARNLRKRARKVLTKQPHYRAAA